ncbi:hypothetical protein CGRA01v4_05536 [Colletotrichum graminicola]|nr:hypothetical protein CGRA01v4_05536 [Colletotrichum graminicola]
MRCGWYGWTYAHLRNGTYEIAAPLGGCHVTSLRCFWMSCAVAPLSCWWHSRC